MSDEMCYGVITKDGERRTGLKAGKKVMYTISRPGLPVAKDVYNLDGKRLRGCLSFEGDDAGIQPDTENTTR